MKKNCRIHSCQISKATNRQALECKSSKSSKSFFENRKNSSEKISTPIFVVVKHIKLIQNTYFRSKLKHIVTKMNYLCSGVLLLHRLTLKL